MNARELTYGIAIGAGLMYFLDPRRGNARLATIRQKATRAAHEVEGAARIGARDLEHRASGLAARLQRVFGERESNVSDDVLVARVRAKLGHVCSHPDAIDVAAKGGGCIELKGPILQDEAEQVLSAIQRVRGVRTIDDDLELHERSGDVPGLHGAPVRRRRNRVWTPAARFVAALGATGVGVASLVKGNPVGLIAGGAVALGATRSIAHRGAPRPRARVTEKRHRDAPGQDAGSAGQP
jgi:BON domain